MLTQIERLLFLSSMRLSTRIPIPNFPLFSMPSLDEQFQSFQENVIVRPTPEQIRIATRLVNYRDIENPINTRCPISLEPFQTDTIVTEILHCNHLFIPDTFNQWINLHVQCPVCRYDIREYTIPSPRSQNTSLSSQIGSDDSDTDTNNNNNNDNDNDNDTNNQDNTDNTLNTLNNTSSSSLTISSSNIPFSSTSQIIPPSLEHITQELINAMINNSNSNSNSINTSSSSLFGYPNVDASNNYFNFTYPVIDPSNNQINFG